MAGSGKDTAANAMLAEFERQGQEAHINGLADPIRRISLVVGLNPYARTQKEKAHIFGVDAFCDKFQHGIDYVLGSDLTEHERAELYAFTVEALGPFIYEGEGADLIVLSPREFMQILGTEGGQHVRPSLWVDLAASRWQGMPGTVLVPDIRFGHELAILDTAVVVIRPGIEPVSAHASEHMAVWLSLGRDIEDETGHPVRQKFLWLHNDGSQEDFETKAQKLARELVQGGAAID